MFSRKITTNASRPGHGGVGVRTNDFSHTANESTSPPYQSDSDEDFDQTRTNSRPVSLSGNGTEKFNTNRVSQLKYHLADAAVAVRVAFNTPYRQQDPRESAEPASPRGLVSHFGKLGKTDTSLTDHDISHGKLQSKIYQEIKKNYSEETKTGFFPGPRLVELLNLEALERELTRSD
ncbi:hypothetical protein NUW58_g6676 [Xylaria curta]|uniref:Uncharacterized protein n=1 Tax=Xylaria curta TaxID=42375 RepID=A0ACC1NRQ9_9PEZI|nr:hypothetical protein NUW58_g6676 [Xylaria curta]